MARYVYSDEMLSFLKGGYKQMRLKPLTEAFNSKFDADKKWTAIKAVLKNHNFTCGRKPGFVKDERMLLLTPEQVEFVKEQYKHMSRKDLLTSLNGEFNLELKLGQLVAFLKNHQIRSGRTGCYKKGNVPFNAGTKGVMKANSGSFQKGSRPKNYKPIGYERVCSKDGYIIVKVAEENPWSSSVSGWYRHKHVVIWEENNGPVPDGSCLRFKDGDSRNIALDNLVLVSRGENARLNLMSYKNQPDQVKPIVMSLAKLDQAVFEKSK